MNEYVVIELENNIKYAVIDILEYNNKKYFLVSKVLDGSIVEGEYKLCIYNETKNYFDRIDNEEEHNFIMAMFERKLEKQRKVEEKLNNINYEEMIKLRIINIDGYNYTLESINGKRVIKHIDFYIQNKPKINSYIYMSRKVLEEKNIFQYGIINDLNNISVDEIIKIVDDKEYFLQRYYG